jgi:integrase
MPTPDRPKKHYRKDGLRKICGCPPRSWSRCGHVWYFAYMWKLKPWRFSLDREVARPITTEREARKEAERIKTEIRAGTFRVSTTATTPAALPLREYADIFLAQFKPGRTPTARQNDASRLAVLTAFRCPDGRILGELPIGLITEGELEVFLAALQTRGRAASTRNHYLQLFKSLSRWGVKKGYLLRPWIGPETDLKREKGAQRHRRVSPEEVQALLAEAHPRLQRLIIGALETACRLGELLGLRWADVDLNRGEVHIRAESAKSRNHRVLPLSARLKAVLEMARLDPRGHPFPPEASVFGNAVGDRLKQIRTAWETAVLKAHGIEPTRTATGQLTATARRQLQEIDLHFHDLRHEAGSRFLEAGWPIHHVKDMLGHADLKTTGIYLNVTTTGLKESMAKFDDGRPTLQEFATPVPAEHRPSGKPASGLTLKATLQ